MASNTLQAVITADISDLKAKLAQADKLIDQYTNNISKVQNAISKNTNISQGYEKQLQDLNNQLQKGSISQEQYAKESGDVTTRLIKVQNETRDYQKELRRLEAELNRVQKASTKVATNTNRTATATGNLGKTAGIANKNVGGATSVMTSFSQVVQDAPYGIRGVANNIQQLTSQFGYLSQRAGGAGGAIKAMVGSLTGPAGILLAVSLVTSLLVTYGDTMFKSSKSTEKAKEELDKFNESLDTHEELLRGVNKSRLDGSKSAVDQITKLNLLKNQLDDVNLSSHERLKAYNELQKLYPSYFSNFTEEAVLAGRLTGQYEILSAALLKKAKAQAAANLITKNAENQLVIDSKIAKIQQDIADQEIKNNELLAKGQAIRSRGANLYIKNAEKGEKQIEKWREEVTKLTGESNKLTKEIENLTDEVSKQGGIIDLDFDIDENKAKEEVKEVVQEISNDVVLPIKVTPQVSGLQGLESEGLQGLDNLSIKDADIDLSGLNKIGPAVTKAQQALINFNTQAGLIIQEGIADTFGNLGSAIGDALANGDNVLAAAGKSLLSSLGAVLVQLGEMAIAIGTSLIAIQISLGTLNPFVAIAAGIALVALGSLFQSKTKEIGDQNFAHGGIVSGGSYTGDKIPVMVNSGEMILNQGQQSRLFNILSGNLSSLQGGNQGVLVGTLRAEGTEIVAVVKKVQDRNQRLGGSRKL